MIEITPAHAQHFNHLRVTSGQSAEFAALWKPGYLEGLLTGPAYTAWASGLCLGAAGVIRPWPGRGECWTIFSVHAEHHMPGLIRAIRRMLPAMEDTRLDMMVAEGNETGIKLAKLCGFQYECTLEKYHPLGCDALVYKRIKRT